MAIREYPKLMYNPDGRTVAARTADEEAAYTAAGWLLIPVSTTQGIRQVPATTLPTTWLAPNAKRKSLKLVNDSPSQAKFKYGPTCLPADYSWVLDPGERWEMPLILVNGNSQPEYLGLITGLWITGVGGVQITELEFA